MVPILLLKWQGVRCSCARKLFLCPFGALGRPWMFTIDRKNPWPPRLDLATARATLQGLERDMKPVPELRDVRRALQDALHAIDRAEATSPIRLSGDVLTHSRFQPPSG